MILNPFEDSNAFGVVELSKAINILPNNYGKLRERNLFPVRGVRSRTIIIEEKHGVLNLLPTLPPGSPGTQGKRGRRKVRSLVIPHIPHDDAILPSEWEGQRAFGSETEVDTLASIMNDHLETMRLKHGITLEHLRMGALKGTIVDADGSTIYNLYTEFGVTQVTVDFVLGTATTNIAAKCRSIVRSMGDNLKGEVMSGVRCLVSAEFFDALVSHALVEKYFINYSQAMELAGRGGDIRKGFNFNGVTFEEYRGVATKADGTTTTRFIASGEGHAYPEGTQSAFETLAAPADFVETVNTQGQLIYAKQELMKFGRGVDVHTQSNPLPVCYRPKLLIKVHSSN